MRRNIVTRSPNDQKGDIMSDNSEKCDTNPSFNEAENQESSEEKVLVRPKRELIDVPDRPNIGCDGKEVVPFGEKDN